LILKLTGLAWHLLYSVTVEHTPPWTYLVFTIQTLKIQIGLGFDYVRYKPNDYSHSASISTTITTSITT